MDKSSNLTDTTRPVELKDVTKPKEDNNGENYLLSYDIVYNWEEIYERKEAVKNWTTKIDWRPSRTDEQTRASLYGK